jgi:hypothetical protein
VQEIRPAEGNREVGAAVAVVHEGVGEEANQKFFRLEMMGTFSMMERDSRGDGEDGGSAESSGRGKRSVTSAL